QSRVINAIDVKCVYEVPLVYMKAGVHENICRHFNLEARPIHMHDWKVFLENSTKSREILNIAVCGKYVKHQDAYKSVEEALHHSAASQKLKLNIKWVDSEKKFKPTDLDKELSGIDGILIPGGFGLRGIEGKILIAQFARTRGIPYFGICLGMQVAAIEYARNVCGLKDANSSEFDELTPHPVIDLMQDQQYLENLGGTMRLGAFPCAIRKNSLAHQIYEGLEISERHRHRFEFNNKYRSMLNKAGMEFTGLSPDETLVEIIEIPAHPFMIGVQFHPEFQSRPNRPQPVFSAFIKAAKLHQDKKKQG
ncbi:MAG: CTP synthase, partial [Candidatus Cloacimonadaceae bacterium]|nr:CTP synthase [Candidatus Cloacimonadaceae bacterium]